MPGREFQEGGQVGGVVLARDVAVGRSDRPGGREPSKQAPVVEIDVGLWPVEAAAELPVRAVTLAAERESPRLIIASPPRS